MKIEADRKYTKSHEWVLFEGDGAAIGLSDYAQDALGDLVFVNLPQEGDELAEGEVFADVESVKAVSDITPPSPAPCARSTRPCWTRLKPSTRTPTAPGW